MAEATENDKKLAASSAMRQFYRTLAAVHDNAIERVMQDDDPDKIIERAKEQTTRMRVFENMAENPPYKCGNGYIWSQKLGRCVPAD